jgi:hypothetical protein
VEHDLFRKPVSTFRDHAQTAAITRRSISAMLVTPVSAMLMSSSFLMISMARVTPASPPAPSP